MKKKENSREKNIGKDNGNGSGKSKSRESEKEKEIKRYLQYLEFSKTYRHYMKKFSEEDMDKDENKLLNKLKKIKRLRQGNRSDASQ